MDRFPHTGPGGSFTSPHSPPPYLEGHEATLHCDPGYTLPSTTRRTARVVTQHDGTLAWEPHTLNCLPVSCGAPPDIPAHGYLTAQNFTFPHAFSYACEPGYRLEPPPPRPNVFYCGVTGHWTPALPSTTPVRCERVQCPPLAPPNGSSVHLTDQFFFGSVATYRCNPPHVRVRGGEASRTCQADGQWSGGGGEEEVECGEVQCPPPLVELSRVVYASPQLQIIACNEGQQVVVVKCLASGRWSKDPPYCSTTTTQTKPPAAGGAAAAAAAATAVGGTAAVEPVVKPMSVPVVLLFLVIGMIVWVLWIYYPWKGKEKKNK